MASSSHLHFPLARTESLSPPRPLKVGSRGSSQGSYAAGGTQEDTGGKHEDLYSFMQPRNSMENMAGKASSPAFEFDSTLGQDEAYDAEYLKSLFRGVRSASRTSLTGGSMTSFPGPSSQSFGMSFDRLFDN